MTVTLALSKGRIFDETLPLLKAAGIEVTQTPTGLLAAAEALSAAGLAPVVLTAKEGLALINGTQVSTALAIDALFQAERVFDKFYRVRKSDRVRAGTGLGDADAGDLIARDRRHQEFAPHLV